MSTTTPNPPPSTDTSDPYGDIAGSPEGVVVVKTFDLLTLTSGSPVGVLGGQNGSSSSPPDIVWDWIGRALWICTQSGPAGTARWDQILYASNLEVTSITATGQIHGEGALVIDGDAQLNSTLEVKGAAAFSSNVTVDGSLEVLGSSTLNGGVLNGTFGGSPTFSGAPTAATPAAGDNSQLLATTAFVESALAAGTATVIVSDTEPPLVARRLWFDSVGAQLYVCYDDGNSIQWVVADSIHGSAGGGSVGGVPEPPADGVIYGRQVTTTNAASWIPVLPLTGGTLTGTLILNSALTVTGATTMSGTVSVPNPTADGQAATKLYVDSAVKAGGGGGGTAGIGEAPTTPAGSTYVRQGSSASWVLAVPAAGGTFTGSVTITGPTTLNSTLAVSGNTNVQGLTILGATNLTTAPTVGANIANKTYVDSAIAAIGTGGGAAIHTLPVVTTMAPSDTLGITQGGVDSQIAASDFFNALTQVMASLPTAVTPASTDTFASDQGGTSLVKQSLGQLASAWFPQTFQAMEYPTIPISGAVTLGYAQHQNQTLVATADTTIHPPASFTLIGDGFKCDVQARGHTITLDTASGMIVPSTSLKSFAAGSAQFRGTSAGGVNSIEVTLPAAAGVASQVINLPPIPSQLPTTAFQFHATPAGYSIAPAITISTNSGSTYGALPTGSTVTTTDILVNYGSGLAIGSYGVILKDGNGVLSNGGTPVTLTVAAGASITFNGPAPTPTGSNVALSGSYNNYGAGKPAAIDISWNNGASYVTPNGFSNITVTAGATGSGTWTATLLTANAPAAGSYAQTMIRDHAGTPVSAAATMIIEAASITGWPTTGTVGTPLAASSFTLTGITAAWAGLWNGTAEVGSRIAITGASGAMPSFTPTATGSLYGRIYDAATGGNVLTTSTAATIGAATPAVIDTAAYGQSGVAVWPLTIGQVGTSMTFKCRYVTGPAPVSVLVSIDGATETTVTIDSTVAGPPNYAQFHLTPAAAGYHQIAIRVSSGDTQAVGYYWADSTGTQGWTQDPAFTYHIAPPVSPLSYASGANPRLQPQMVGPSGSGIPTSIPSEWTGAGGTSLGTAANVPPGWYAGWTFANEDGTVTVPPWRPPTAYGIPTVNRPPGTNALTSNNAGGSSTPPFWIDWTSNLPRTAGSGVTGATNPTTGTANVIYAFCISPLGFHWCSNGGGPAGSTWTGGGITLTT